MDEYVRVVKGKNELYAYKSKNGGPEAVDIDSAHAKEILLSVNDRLKYQPFHNNKAEVVGWRLITEWEKDVDFRDEIHFLLADDKCLNVIKKGEQFFREKGIDLDTTTAVDTLLLWLLLSELRYGSFYGVGATQAELDLGLEYRTFFESICRKLTRDSEMGSSPVEIGKSTQLTNGVHISIDLKISDSESQEES